MRKRVLYVCLEQLSPGAAASTHVGAVVDGLEREGFEVRVHAVTHSVRRGSFLERALRYVKLYLRNAASLPFIDILYVRSHFMALPIEWAARLLRRPVVHEVNGSYRDAVVTHPVLGRFGPALAAVQRRQYAMAAAVIAVTPGLADWARRISGHDRVVFVSNGADTRLFSPDGPISLRSRPYVIFFGGLVRWHGIGVLIGASRHPCWPSGIDLVIAGPIVDPAIEADLRRAPPHVDYIGAIAQSELPRLVRGAIGSLCPITDPSGRSQNGVLPLKMFESLGCGIPVIVSDLPGQRDLIREHQCGIVVPCDDSEALAAAVADLVRDRERAAEMGRRGAVVVRNRYSWDVGARAVAAVLKDALRRRGS